MTHPTDQAPDLPLSEAAVYRALVAHGGVLWLDELVLGGVAHVRCQDPDEVALAAPNVPYDVLDASDIQAALTGLGRRRLVLVDQTNRAWARPMGVAQVHAGPYSARRCVECQKWVYTADGPFAEDGDPTKTMADWLHWSSAHPEKVEPGALGFPFFDYNDEPVDAIREDWGQTPPGGGVER